MTMSEAGSGTKQAWLQAAAVFAIALLVRLVNLDQDAHIDEFFHILAARSWLADGELRIADGLYTRGWLYTKALGLWFDLFGTGIVTARIPSVLAGSLWVAAVYLWTRRVAGNGAAWVAAVLFALAPGAVWLSQFTRFYAIHGLLFWLASIGVYHLFTQPLRPASAAIALGVSAGFGVALHLQVTTLIGLVGVGLWVAWRLALAWRDAPVSPRTRRLGFAAAVLLALAVAAGLLVSGTLAEMWRILRSVAFWNLEGRDYEGYYFNLFLEQYPVLWPLLPVAAIVALAGRPRPALFACVVFATAFVLHSLAGSKLERYIYYAMPFAFVLWGIALAELWPALRGALSAATTRALAALGIDRPRGLQRLASAAVLAVAGTFLVLATPALTQTLGTLVEPPEPERTEAWQTARRRIEPLVDSVDVLLTTDELRSLYYFGRYDILVNKVRMMETPNPGEFHKDPRTGRPIVSTTESVRLILECYPSGLFISNEYYWRSDLGMTEAAADLLEAQAEPIEFPTDYKLFVYHWDTGRVPDADKCAKLPRRRDATRMSSAVTN